MPSGMLTDPSDPRKAVLSAPAVPAELSDPSLYLNRELTWLAFNERVLAEGEDDRTPLLERVKFLAIVASNLDEFFMKRIGGLKQQAAAGLQEKTVDGRTPRQQIDECYAAVREIQGRARALLPGLLRCLRESGIGIVRLEELSPAERKEPVEPTGPELRVASST